MRTEGGIRRKAGKQSVATVDNIAEFPHQSKLILPAMWLFLAI